MIILSILILSFIGLSGLLAMIDAAILSVTQAEVEEAVLEKKWGALALRRIKTHITQAVVVIVIATNTVNVLGPILIGHSAAKIYGNTVLGVIAAILTFATIVFSEIIPKSLGAHYAPRVSRVSAPFILTLIYLLFPLVSLLEELSAVFKSGKRRIGTEAQICSLASLGHKAGYIEDDEGELIKQVFQLNDKTASDIMTPISKVICFREEESIAGAAQVVVRNKYSRYPVFGQNTKDIIGVAFSRDVLKALAENKGEEPLSSIIKKTLLVSSDKAANQLLMIFKETHSHMALVQKQGQTKGIVTLEDVLEELVGEIEDEKDLKAA